MQMKENLLPKMYIEAALMSKSLNIALNIHNIGNPIT